MWQNHFYDNVFYQNLTLSLPNAHWKKWINMSNTTLRGSWCHLLQKWNRCYSWIPLALWKRKPPCQKYIIGHEKHHHDAKSISLYLLSNTKLRGLWCHLLQNGTGATVESPANPSMKEKATLSKLHIGHEKHHHHAVSILLCFSRASSIINIWWPNFLTQVVIDVQAEHCLPALFQDTLGLQKTFTEGGKYLGDERNVPSGLRPRYIF